MPLKDEWIEGKEAAAILSQNSKHKVSLDYVRKMAHQGLIRFRKKDGRTNEYSRLDIERYTVRKNKTPPRPQEKTYETEEPVEPSDTVLTTSVA